MSEWWTYRLGSFLLFSPRTYHRLFELYNEAIWPLQLATAALGLVIAALVVRRSRHGDRIVAGLLAACWLWTAWVFLYQRYAQINWVAPWFAAAFALEALLLVAAGVVAGRAPLEGGGRPRIAALLMVATVLGYPLLAPLGGRAWTTAEAFGVAPDPTAIATVATIAAVRGRIRWLLLALPVLWCVVASLTHWAMGAPEAVVIAVAALVAVVLAFS